MGAARRGGSVLGIALLACAGACRTYDTIYTSDAGGQCVAPRFPCNGACVDPTSDRLNCGACGDACGANELCSDSACVPCPVAGELACGTSGAAFCVDVSSNDLNCGACGRACGHGTLCRDGACVCPLTACGADCVDTTSDAQHCGSCEHACSAPGPNEVPLCSNGQCGVTCASPWADCDGLASNGCEANLQSDAADCGLCGRACVGGGACQGGLCPVAQYATGAALGGLAVDASFVYWADRAPGGSILRAPVGGGAAQSVAADDSATLLAVDATRVVWLHLNDEIHAQLLSGGATAVIAATPGIFDMKLAGGTVYFSTSSAALYRVPADGSQAPVTMTAGTVAETLAVDGTDVYFATSGSGTVFEVPVGAQSASPSVFAPNADARMLAVDATRVYWSTGSGEILAQAKGATKPTVLASGQSVLSNLAADGASLYWFDGSGRVMRLPVTGAAPLALATNLGTPVGETVAVDASRVYWTSALEVAATTK